MGKLIKNHWARLIVLTAATCGCSYPAPGLSCPMSATMGPFHADFARAPDQIAAAIEGFFWPKCFWDFLTKNLDGAVKPVPVLQVLNLILGIVAIAWEWPLKRVAGTAVHRSAEARLVVYSLSALVAVLMYQATNPALYYLIGIGAYLRAYVDGEVSSSQRSGTAGVSFRGMVCIWR